MSQRAALNVSTPPELAAYVAALVAFERYGTASEVIRTGLRFLQGKENTRAGALTAASETQACSSEH